MKKSSIKTFKPLFSHIYVEKNILNNKITKEILNKFKNSKVIIINDYKEVFSGFDQNFSLQKNSQKLILARKKDNFFYKGSNLCHDFNNSTFFYTNNILNCLYDCKYCYLGGMYPSSNIVIFVNIEDYFENLEKISKDYEDIYLSVGYETDAVLFEFIYPFLNLWFKKINDLKNVKIEIRSKSNILHKILPMKVSERIIPAWTINPGNIIYKYEKRTPSLEKRIESIKKAQKNGWKIRLSIDPIIIENENKEDYIDFIKKIFMNLETNKIRDISIGLFRLPNSYLKNLKKHSNSPIIFKDYNIINSIATYSSEQKERIMKLFIKELAEYIDKEKIFII